MREIEEDNTLFYDAAQALGIELLIVEYDDVRITFDNNTQYIDVKNQALENFDLVHFRNVGNNLEMQIILSQFCLSHNVPIYDQVFRYSSPWIDRKSFEYTRLAQHDLPTIHSYFVSQKTFLEIQDRVTYPAIVKLTDGKWGEGVFKCTTHDEIVAMFDQHHRPLLIQKFVENDGDIRLFVIGGQVIGSIKRSATKEGEFRNNVALGGKAQLHTPSELEKTIALQAAAALEYDIAGVDLVFDKHEQTWKVIEVNRGPKFMGLMEVTGINVPEKILHYFLNELEQ